MKFGRGLVQRRLDRNAERRRRSGIQIDDPAVRDLHHHDAVIELFDDAVANDGRHFEQAEPQHAVVHHQRGQCKTQRRQVEAGQRIPAGQRQDVESGGHGRRCDHRDQRLAIAFRTGQFETENDRSREQDGVRVHDVDQQPGSVARDPADVVAAGHDVRRLPEQLVPFVGPRETERNRWDDRQRDQQRGGDPAAMPRIRQREPEPADGQISDTGRLQFGRKQLQRGDGHQRAEQLSGGPDHDAQAQAEHRGDAGNIGIAADQTQRIARERQREKGWQRPDGQLEHDSSASVFCMRRDGCGLLHKIRTARRIPQWSRRRNMTTFTFALPDWGSATPSEQRGIMADRERRRCGG